jgi:hypothetical protein
LHKYLILRRIIVKFSFRIKNAIYLPKFVNVMLIETWINYNLLILIDKNLYLCMLKQKGVEICKSNNNKNGIKWEYFAFNINIIVTYSILI